mmetsp:Transcript_16089/g.44844  ORF Transcript_16089/g.44844 Transcript_16089/m.44844 type:complete len:136 (+) Transcript_16089:611-1018(+)
MKESDIAIHAVTAEPGGSKEILERLRLRGVADLPFPVHSDPNHSLLLASPKESVYILEEKKVGGMRSLSSKEYEDYHMVQPAMFMLDSAGKLQWFWSWRTISMPFVLPSPMLRPQASDLVAAVREGRPPKFTALA